MLSSSGDGHDQGGTVRNPPEAVHGTDPRQTLGTEMPKRISEKQAIMGPGADPIPRGELISDSMSCGSDETSRMHEGTLSINHHLTR
jgi:hypothetical protein